MGVAAVRRGLADRLRTLADLKVYDHWPSRFAMPGAAVVYRTGQRHTSFDKRGTVHFDIIAAVQVGQWEQAQAQLDEYLDIDGPRSIQVALEADESLGGASEGLIVGDSEYAIDIDLNATDYLAGRVPVEVWVVYP